MTAAPLLPVTIDQVDALMPQTQCTRCGYPDCRSYARAISLEAAPINRCPPGGAEGMARLADLTGQALPLRLDPTCGEEGPRLLAVIDEAWCIGCTLCIKACPVDCIVGSHKQMHSVIESQCTGCELCLPACPVDCISLVDAAPGLTGWAAWSEADAATARLRYQDRTRRTAEQAEQNASRLQAKAQHKLAHLEALTRHDDSAPEQDRKRDVINAALARARAQRRPADDG